ncbi:MAG: hypothetical protein MZV63_09200 [Marinilabiliales bacterium]|nr:hypothetical protein [Marinilabiliales bacterium]
MRLLSGKDIRRLFRRSLKLRQVSAGGDNSCEMELNASGNVNFDVGRYGIEFVASPRHADGIVITGPVTENMAEALEICYKAVPVTQGYYPGWHRCHQRRHFLQAVLH